ncbi:uncharacterized protein LOC143896440 [Temnothorax americanus]|uniref:uncharacterized protein LOC143896440 n=1 Tax=Temnothorax americanus TaxID=1964332 RepID=UPI004069607F
MLEREFQNDAGALREWLGENAIIIVDRGYRDVLPLLQNLGIETYMPPLLQENQTQLSTEDANDSRLIIKSQWIVKALNRVTPQQLSSSRKVFQSVAQKQADAEFMYAEAAKVQAEASKMNALAVTEIAHAIQKLADIAAVQAVNDSEQIRVFEKLTSIMDNMLPNYLNDQAV